MYPGQHALPSRSSPIKQIILPKAHNSPPSEDYYTSEIRYAVTVFQKKINFGIFATTLPEIIIENLPVFCYETDIFRVYISFEVVVSQGLFLLFNSRNEFLRLGNAP